MTSNLRFKTTQSSPFTDGYDIEGEKVDLADLLEADNPDTTDPRWARVVELEQRITQLSQMRNSYRHRSGADRLVTDREAAGFRSMGRLVDEELDSMMLHTVEAYLLFMGRSRDPDGQYNRVIGGRRVASALRSAWVLSGYDNPYADWALVTFMDHLDAMKQELKRAISEYEGIFTALRQRGLNYSILSLKEPKVVELGFRSPYGYAVAELITDYDFFVRMVKTLVRKDRISDSDGRIVLRQMVRRIRRMFEAPSKYERFLMREELRQLCRADWLPGANEESRKRVQAVVGIFGEVPREVFTGSVVPRHSRRRVSLSEQELKLLQQVALSPELDAVEADASGLL